VGASVPVFVQGVISASLGSCFAPLNAIVDVDRASALMCCRCPVVCPVALSPSRALVSSPW
jgi:hypothetical protein